MQSYAGGFAGTAETPTLRWKGGALIELDVHLPHPKPQIIRTDEDTIELVRRLAAHYPDAVIAGILNRQGRKTAYGYRFEISHVANLRRRWKIPVFDPSVESSEGELLSIKKSRCRARRCAIDPASSAQRWNHWW
jgi:hypothetical protein